MLCIQVLQKRYKEDEWIDSGGNQYGNYGTVEKACFQAKVGRRRNLRNGTLALALGSFLIFGGILSLDVGMGIYLLITGSMFLALVASYLH